MISLHFYVFVHCEMIFLPLQFTTKWSSKAVVLTRYFARLLTHKQVGNHKYATPERKKTIFIKRLPIEIVYTNTI